MWILRYFWEWKVLKCWFFHHWYAKLSHRQSFTLIYFSFSYIHTQIYKKNKFNNNESYEIKLFKQTSSCRTKRHQVPHPTLRSPHLIATICCVLLNYFHFYDDEDVCSILSMWVWMCVSSCFEIERRMWDEGLNEEYFLIRFVLPLFFLRRKKFKLK